MSPASTFSSSGGTTVKAHKGEDGPVGRATTSKYRKSIKQKLAQFEDYVRYVKAMAARIDLLLTLVTNAQDAIRSKRSLREAENIRLFTYATVLLPARRSRSQYF